MPEVNCDTCGVSYSNKRDFREHSWTLMHHIKKEHKEGKSSHFCSLCKKPFSNLPEYGRHLNEIEHKNNVEDDRRARSPDSTQKSGSSTEGEHNRSRKAGRYPRVTCENQDSKLNVKGGTKPPQRNRSWDRGNQNTKGRQTRFSPQQDLFVTDSQCDSDRSFNQKRNVPFWQDNRNYAGQSGWHDFGPPQPHYQQGAYQQGNSGFHAAPWKANQNYYGAQSFQQALPNYLSDSSQQYEESAWEKWDKSVSSSQSVPNDKKGSTPSSSATQSRSASQEEVSVAKEEPLSNKASKLIDDILSGKPVTQSVPKEKETAKNSEATSRQPPDQGADILKKAERMCKELRKEREVAKKKSSDRAKAKQKEERKKLDEQIASLSQTSMSGVSGILDRSQLNDPPSQLGSGESLSENSSAFSSVKSMYQARYLKPSQPSASSVISSAAHTTGSVSGILPRPSRPSSSASSTVSRGPTIPLKDTRHKVPTGPALTKTTKKSGELDTDNLVKLVAPRSRKEWNDLKKILHKYKKKWSRPRLNLIDKYDDQIKQCGESAEMEMEDLPQDIQDQISQLLDDVMSDYSVCSTSNLGNPEYESNVITIAPEDDDTEVSGSFAGGLDLFGQDESYSSLIPNNTSTPAGTPAYDRHRARHAENRSCLSGSHTDLFNDSNSTTVTLTTSNCVPSANSTSYGSPALDEYAKQIDAEIATIASGQPGASISEGDKPFLLGATVSGDRPDPIPSENSLNMYGKEPETHQPCCVSLLQSVTHTDSVTPQPIYVLSSPATHQEPLASVKTENMERSVHSPDICVVKEDTGLDSPARLATSKRRREAKLETPSPVEPPEKQQTKRPKIEQNGISIVVLSDSDESMSEQSTRDEASCTMESVYELSLKEEDIRGKLGETAEEIATLEALIERTTEQLKQKREIQIQLQNEEEKLRSKRLKILKGAVTELKNSSRASVVTQSEPDSTVIQIENSPERVKMEVPPAPEASVINPQQLPEPSTTDPAQEENSDEAQAQVGLQYIGTLDATGMDPSLVEQLAVNYSNEATNSSFVFMEESHFQKCLSDSTMSQESDEEPERSPPKSHDGIFKRPKPVSEVGNGRRIKVEPEDCGSQKQTKIRVGNVIKTEKGEDVQAHPSKVPSVMSSSMTSLDTIAEEKSGSGSKSNISGPAKERKIITKTGKQDSESENDSRHKNKKKKKKPKDIKQAPLESSSDATIAREPKKGKRTQDPETQKVLREYLHASSSSDVSMEGLNSPSRPSSVKKKKKKSEGKMKTTVPKQATSDSGSDVNSRDNSFESVTVSRLFPAGHNRAVRCIQAKRSIITGGDDGSVKEFNAETYVLKTTFYGHKAEVLCVLVVDGNQKYPPVLYTGSSDSMLIAFNLTTGKQISKHRYADKVCALAYCPSLGSHKERLFIGLGSGCVTTCNPRSGANIDAFKHSVGQINCLATTREGPRQILCVVGQDCSIGVRDANNSLLLRSLEGHTKPPLALKVWSNLVFSGGPDGMVQIHNLNTGDMQRMIRMQDTVNSLGITPCGRYLIVAGNKGVITCFNTQSYTQDKIYYSHGKAGVTAMSVGRKTVVYVGTKEGSIESIKITNGSWACKFGMCKLVCGRKEDLQYHVMHDHVSAMSQSGDGCCLWNDCTQSISMKDDELGTVRHIAAHIER